MNRAEVRAIVRRMLSPEDSTLVGDLELNSIINQGLIELARELGGEVTSSTLTTDANGFATLPSDILQIFRLEYEGVRMNRVSYDEIAELEESS